MDGLKRERSPILEFSEREWEVEWRWPIVVDSKIFKDIDFIKR